MTQFFRDVWAELQKVVWPSRQETVRYTAVVILFSIGVAAILGAFDYGMLKMFEKIITR